MVRARGERQQLRSGSREERNGDRTVEHDRPSFDGFNHSCEGLLVGRLGRLPGEVHQPVSYRWERGERRSREVSSGHGSSHLKLIGLSR